ncbi:PqqD family protein [Candidatus Magnetomoraceae bacterium gMMP-15]
MSKNVITKELKDEFMVYDMDEDELHVLNQSARLVYKLYKEGKTASEIEKQIRKNFSVREDRDVCKDIQRCLDELKSKGI